MTVRAAVLALLAAIVACDCVSAGHGGSSIRAQVGTTPRIPGQRYYEMEEAYAEMATTGESHGLLRLSVEPDVTDVPDTLLLASAVDREANASSEPPLRLTAVATENTSEHVFSGEARWREKLGTAVRQPEQRAQPGALDSFIARWMF